MTSPKERDPLELRRAVETSILALQGLLPQIDLEANYDKGNPLLDAVRKHTAAAVAATSRSLEFTDDAGLADGLVIDMNGQTVQGLGTASEQDTAQPVTAVFKDFTLLWRVDGARSDDVAATLDDVVMMLRRVEMAIDSGPDSSPTSGREVYRDLVQFLTLLLTVLAFLSTRR